MALLSVQNIGHAFGERVLFEKGSFNIEERDKVGFIGANGVGKTTLFKVITKSIVPSEGEIIYGKDCVIGYMEQHALQNSGKTLFEEVLTVFDYLAEMEEELSTVTLAIERKSGDPLKLAGKQSELRERFEDMGGLTYTARTKSTLTGLGFTEDDLFLPVSALSGGQRTMAMLAKLLLSRANLLLLDEPTNHLDIEACSWLEDFLKSFKGAAIIISHDRYFLDKITNKTVELENTLFTIYNGNYSVFARKKADEREYARRSYENQMKEIKRIEGIIENQRRWNRERNIRTAESKQKQIERIEKELVKPDEESGNVHFDITPQHDSGNEVLIASGVKKSFEGNLLFENASLDIRKNDRAFLLGPNGCGKTTLFRIIRGDIPSDSGFVKYGSRVSTGSFDQIQSDLSSDKSIIEEIRDEHPLLTDTEIRNALAAFLLKGDDVFKKIKDLSGGERAKVALLKVILHRPNFLLLDEPTNHLDIGSKEALEDALLSYGGTILAVSHDRYFINKLATKVFAFGKSEIKCYAGDYDYFISKNLTEEKKEETEAGKISEYHAEKQKRSEERLLQGKIKRLEDEIEAKEKEEEELGILLTEAGSDYQKVIEISEKIAQIKSETEELYIKWEELHS